MSGSITDFPIPRGVSRAPILDLRAEGTYGTFLRGGVFSPTIAALAAIAGLNPSRFQENSPFVRTVARPTSDFLISTRIFSASELTMQSSNPFEKRTGEVKIPATGLLGNSRVGLPTSNYDSENITCATSILCAEEMMNGPVKIFPYSEQFDISNTANNLVSAVSQIPESSRPMFSSLTKAIGNIYASVRKQPYERKRDGKKRDVKEKWKTKDDRLKPPSKTLFLR